MPGKTDPELIDDDAPEATAQWFEIARPAAEVLPGLIGTSAADALPKPSRRRPLSATPEEHLNIRFDADIVQSFKRTGAGWQTRLNSALRECLSTHRS